MRNVATWSAGSLLCGWTAQKIPEIDFAPRLQNCSVLPINFVAKGPPSFIPLNVSGIQREENIGSNNRLLEKTKRVCAAFFYSK